MFFQSKEWISSLKMNGNVSSIAFTQDGSSMYSTGSECSGGQIANTLTIGLTHWSLEDETVIWISDF